MSPTITTVHVPIPWVPVGYEDMARLDRLIEAVTAPASDLRFRVSVLDPTDSSSSSAGGGERRGSMLPVRLSASDSTRAYHMTAVMHVWTEAYAPGRYALLPVEYVPQSGAILHSDPTGTSCIHYVGPGVAALVVDLWRTYGAARAAVDALSGAPQPQELSEDEFLAQRSAYLVAAARHGERVWGWQR